MNKTQLVEAIVSKTNLTKVDARKAIDAMIDITTTTLRQGERITLTGLGTLSVQQRSERTGRNPRTGAAVKIPSRKTVKFRSSVDLEEI